MTADEELLEALGDDAALVMRALESHAAKMTRESHKRGWAGPQFAEIRRQQRTEAHDAYQLARRLRSVS